MSRLTSIVLALASVASVFTASTASAQVHRSFAFDATLGIGHGYGGEFLDRSIEGPRLAASVRTGPQRRVGAFAELAFDWISQTMGRPAVCIESTSGGCMPWYPELAGPEIVVGLMLEPHERVEIRGGVGAAAYRAHGVRVGGALAQLDVALFPARRIGIVGGIRAVVVPRYRKEQLSTFPWLIGLRVR